jgi:hypothetical protein
MMHNYPESLHLVTKGLFSCKFFTYHDSQSFKQDCNNSKYWIVTLPTKHIHATIYVMWGHKYNIQILNCISYKK